MTHAILSHFSNGCQGRHCSDLSPQRQNDGSFSGVLSTAWTLANSLSCIGGLTCLLPILELSNAPIRECAGRKSVEPLAAENINGEKVPPYSTVKSIDTHDSSVTDWVVIDRVSSGEFDICIQLTYCPGKSKFCPSMVGQSIDQDLIDQSSIQSINQSTNQSFIQSIIQSIIQSTNQWMGWCISFQSCFLPDPNVELNPVAAFIGLLRKLLSRNPELQEDIMQLNTLAVTGHLLTKVEERFLDVNLLVALQLLIEAAQGSHVWVDFLAQVYQHLLFDLKIWAKAEFTVRLGHLQYIRKLVKEDKKAFRKKFGVQLFLDSLRVYGTKNCALAATLSEEEGDILRRHTLGIIQEFISHNVSHTEISALIAFLLTVKCERTVDDVLQLILTVTDVIFLEWSFGSLMSN